MKTGNRQPPPTASPLAPALSRARGSGAQKAKARPRPDQRAPRRLQQRRYNCIPGESPTAVVESSSNLHYSPSPPYTHANPSPNPSPTHPARPPANGQHQHQSRQNRAAPYTPLLKYEHRIPALSAVSTRTDTKRNAACSFNPLLTSSVLRRFATPHPQGPHVNNQSRRWLARQNSSIPRGT